MLSGFVRRSTNSVASAISSRSMASLSMQNHGVPSKVVGYDSKKAEVKAAGANEAVVKIQYATVSTEDIRAIRGVSHVNSRSSGLLGNTGIGSLNNELFLVSNAGTWADSVVAPKDSLVKLSNVTAEEAVAVPSFVAANEILNQLNVASGDAVLLADSETAVGQALTQIAKTRGVNVIVVSSADFKDANATQALKSKGKITAAVAGTTGEHIHSLLKLLPHNGNLTVYNGVYQSLDQAVGVDIPISRSIFQNVKIVGFDYDSWSSNNPTQFRASLNTVLDLISSKKISLKANVYEPADYQKALTDVEKTGKLAAFKF